MSEELGVRQVGAVLHQQLDSGGHCVLLALRESLPPPPELVRVLDLPGYVCSIFQLRNHVQEAPRRPGVGNSAKQDLAHCPSQGVGFKVPN